MAIERRMQAARCRTRSQYLALLEKDPGEVNTLVSSMLIKLTTFFRNAEVWTALEGLLRELVQRRRGNEELRIWSAGCATGEEAYSIAIAATEALGPGNPGPELKLFGTDVDEGAIGEGLHSTHGRAHHDDVLVCRIAPGTPVQAAPEGVPCPARPPSGARKCRHPHPESRRLPGFRRFKCRQGHHATAWAESGRVAFPWGPVALICLHRAGPERAWRPNTHSVPCCLPGEKNHVGDQGPRPRCGR